MIVIFPGLFLAKRRTMDGICCLQPEVQNLRQGFAKDRPLPMCPSSHLSGCRFDGLSGCGAPATSLREFRLAPPLCGMPLTMTMRDRARPARTAPAGEEP
jgi:hypothetical protein